MKQMTMIFFVLFSFALLQISFLVYFFPRGFIPNFIVLAVLVVTIFEKQDSYAGIAAALFGGFLMDVFSTGIIGFWAFLLTFLSLLTKKILEEYVRLPIPKKF